MSSIHTTRYIYIFPFRSVLKAKMHAANCKVKPKENLFLMKSVCRLSKTHSGNNLKSIFRVAYEAKWFRRRGIVYIIV